MATLLCGAKILWEGELVEGHVLLFDQRVLACVPEDRADGLMGGRVDVGGGYAIPGLIDVHVHGCLGHDLMDATDEALDGMSRAKAEEGVTMFLPTSVSAPWEEIEAAVEATRRAMSRARPGAAVAGMHLEGPWIEEARRGAHPSAHIRSEIDVAWIERNADVIRTVTYSPVLDLGLRATRAMASMGVVPSVGHTTASFELARAAFEAGARCVTHLFNAQTGLHHRAPGVPGAAAASGATCELIADGRHVRPELFEPLFRMMGADRIVLITDAMRAAGMSDGSYAFAGETVRVEGGLPYIGETIAGSTLRMDEALRNVLRATGRPLAEVVAMASRSPARLLGLSRKGVLAPGMDADITCLDEELHPRMTFVGGRRVP